MQTFYHTFGIGHPLSHKVQPIRATNSTEALKVMFKKHGDRWAIQYNEKQWEEMKSTDTLLPAIKVPSKKYKGAAIE